MASADEKSRAKAEGFFDDAEKKMSTGWFSRPQPEAASELYVKAGNLFKAAKDFKRAGDSFVKASACQSQVGDMGLEMAATLVKAAACYKKLSQDEYIDCITRAVDAYNQVGQANTAGKYQKEIAEYHESKGNYDEAYAAYEAAADNFEREMVTSSTNQCRLKMADINAMNKKWHEAAVLYENCAREYIQQSERYRVVTHLTNALLCNLASKDYPEVKRNIDYFPSVDNGAFRDSPEFAMCQAVFAAMDAEDDEALREAMEAHQSAISKLMPFIRNILSDVHEDVQRDDLI